METSPSERIFKAMVQRVISEALENALGRITADTIGSDSSDTAAMAEINRVAKEAAEDWFRRRK